MPAAVVATLIYAVPPAVRLTSLGLRQVPVVSTEVGRSFGATGPQLLGKVQLPLARRTVLLGLNQVIMMAFGIVVIASQIGTGDVGVKVLAQGCRSSTPSWRSRQGSASCSRRSPSTASPRANAA